MAPIGDEPLLCPDCKYDLRASAGPLCPECGAPFEPHELREWWNAKNGVTAWERKCSIVSFISTWLSVLFVPLRIARQFPARADSNCATRFTLVCYAVAIGLVIIGGLATGKEWIGPLAAFGGVIGLTVCEFSLAALLGLLGPPTRVSGAGWSYPFWRGLCHYTSAFTVLSGVWGAVGLVVGEYASFFFDELIWNVAGIAIFVWWWVCLAVMVCVRARGVTRKFIGVVLIPIVGGLSIGAGYSAAVLAVSLLI